MNKRPKIGLVGWSTGDNSFGATRAYLHFISMFGDPILLCPMEGIDESLDLVIMPGGKDTPPHTYGQVPGYYNSDADQFKEAFLNNNMPQYIEAKIPIFGICLGFQQLAVYFGAQLIQHISSIHGYSDVDIKGRGDLVNELIFTPEFKPLESNLLRSTPKVKKIKCCSLHHQGVPFEIGKSSAEIFPEVLDPIAYTSDGILEAFKHKSLPIAGVQFHPEEDWNILGRKLMKDLLRKSPNLKNEDITVVQGVEQ
jgi:putative glutamine amidotransferase